MEYPLRVAIIGMGGFAGAHHRAVAELETKGLLRLVCTCDPKPESFAREQEEWCFPKREVAIFDDYLTMLDAYRKALDLIIVPTPIPLHAPMHRACVERGLAVYLEKPPTLDYAELERMIETDSNARHQTVVGFNFIVDPERRQLKRRLIAGEFGTPRQIGVYALWPRGRDYYQRTSWAGKLMLEDRLVLDSCLGNAMAHQVHNALFWGGIDKLEAWAEPGETRAELYRAHPIQGPDTVFVATQTNSGIELRIGMTHACGANDRQQEESIVCDRATLRYYINNSGPAEASYTIHWDNGQIESGPPVQGNFLQMNLLAYAEYLLGQRRRPLTTLSDSRPFVQLNNLTYLAARRIVPFPDKSITREEAGLLRVEELPESIFEFITCGRLPSDQKRDWSQPGMVARPADLPGLKAAVAAMI